MSDLDLPSKTELADELSARGLPDKLVGVLSRKLSKEPKEPVAKAGLKDHVAGVLRKIDGQLEHGERQQLLQYTDQIHEAVSKLAHAAPKPAKVKAEKAKADDEVEPDDPMQAEGEPPVGETS